jgi:hypothetical protein
MPLRFFMFVSYRYSEQILCGLNLQSTSGWSEYEQGRYYRVPNEQPAEALFAFHSLKVKSTCADSIGEGSINARPLFGDSHLSEAPNSKGIL